MKHPTRKGVTIVELTVVILILSILTSMAVSVYIGHIKRARYAVAMSTIKELEVNAFRYSVDMGEFPPSSSGTNFGDQAPNPRISPSSGVQGCGYLTLCLMHSYSGNATNPSSPRWFGPYIDVNQEQLGDIDGNPISSGTPPPMVSVLDPWGRPYAYIRSSDYATLGGTRQKNTPFANLGEIFYNPSTIQIYSMGADGRTRSVPEAGLGADDVSNFSNI